MKERPILFSAPMVRALLDGSKTQTRRVLKGDFMHQPKGSMDAKWYFRGPKMACWDSYETEAELIARHSPYGRPGDRIWVRETHYIVDEGSQYFYKATGGYSQHKEIDEANGNAPLVWAGPWKPSIFMPRRASRITLEIVNVHVERLQDISEADAIAEGCQMDRNFPSDGDFPAEIPHESGIGMVGWDCARDWYADLWEDINGPSSWSMNPWVWVIEFKRVQP